MLESFSWVDLSFLTASCFIVGAIIHRKRQNKKNEHENVYVQEISRLDAHAPLVGFVSPSDARNFVLQFNCSPFVLNLCNKTNWNFKLCNSFSEAVSCLRNEGGSENHAERRNNVCRINVPSQWQLFNLGDVPSYKKISCLQDYDDVLNSKYNPSGYYCNYFYVPQQWERRQVRIVIGGFDCAGYIWLNGIFVGFSKDSFLPAEFDISEAAVFGEKNCVEIIVVKFSDGMLLENHDTWRLNGIFRDVYLLSLPRPVCISDYSWSMNDITNNSNEIGGRYMLTAKIKLDWDLSNSDKLFGQDTSGVYPRHNFVATSAEWVLSSYLYYEGIMVSSSVGKTGGSLNSSPHYFGFDKPASRPISKIQEYVYLPVGSSEIFTPKHPHVHDLKNPRDAKTIEEEEDEFHLSAPLATSPSAFTATILQSHEIKAPRLWSAERPHVYTLVMILKNTTDGSVLQAESCRVTFRTVDINYGLLRVNLKPIMIRGANMHEHDPYKGCCVSRSVMEADVQLMKRNNINAIRTALHPHCSWLYELCTLYGVYVVNEANICTNLNSGNGDCTSNILADDTDWEKSFMTRLVHMFERDKTHGSIIAWSLGSDSSYGKIHDKMANWLGDRDPSRVVMYEPASYGPRVSPTAPTNNANTKNIPKSGILRRKHKRNNCQIATDILCPKYARISECIVLGNRYPDMPLILMEYSDLRGNSGGNLKDYWNAFNSYTRLQGGFLHSWSDQGLCITNSNNDSFWGGFGHFGATLHHSAIDPVFGRWGNNPPGQKSKAGLYPETSFFQVAERNCLKGRYNDAFYTPFNNAPRRGASSYPRLKYGAQKCEIDASALTPGGLTWPDRGIQDKSIFQFHDPPVFDTLKAAFSRPHCHHSYMYGLCPPPLYHKSFYKLLFTAALSDNRLILSQAVSKPQLLEAKCCMSPFDCFIETVDVEENSMEQTVLNHYNPVTACFEPILPPQPSNTKLTKLEVSVKANIVNFLDHVDDIIDDLTFDALLLCNGLVVTSSTLQAKTSAVVHRTYNEEEGRPAFQELEALGDFVVPVTTLVAETSADLKYPLFQGWKQGQYIRTVCGVKCPEDILLVPYSTSDINDTIDKANAEYKSLLADCTSIAEKPIHKAISLLRNSSQKSSKNLVRKDGQGHCQITTLTTSRCQWSLLVVGRTRKDMSWAPLGFPLGFKQCKLLEKFFEHSKPTGTNNDGLKDSNQKSPSRKAPMVRRKSIKKTVTKKKKYVETEPSLTSSSASTGIPVSQHPQYGIRSEFESGETYDISVLWVKPTDQNRCRDSRHERDILLRAVSLSSENETRKGSHAPRVVEVTISGASGSILSYQVDEVELLVTSEAATNDYSPSRFHLHRAPTSIDRGGYLTAWKAVGMDQKLVMRPLKSDASANPFKRPTAPKIGDRITGSNDLEFVNVEHVFMHQQSPSHDAQPKNRFGQGVQCKWEMSPAFVDKGRALLLVQIQQFVNDSRVRSKIVEVRSNGQESFVHEIAKSFRLGRETLSPYSQKNQDSGKHHVLDERDTELGMKAKLYVEYAKIRLWKTAFYPSSTIPYVDTLAVGPFGGLKYDEVDVHDEEDDNPPDQRDNVYSQAYMDSFGDNFPVEDTALDTETHEVAFNSCTSIRKMFSVKFCVCFLLDENATLLLHAQVDVSALPCPLPRIGLQLNINPNVFSQASWLGYGPHENYPDRKSSCVMAVHSANFDSLGVPYITPGENGARCGLEWLQLHNADAGEGGNSTMTKSRTSSTMSLDASHPGEDARSCSASPSQDNIRSASNGQLISQGGIIEDCMTNAFSQRELVVRCSRPFSFSILNCSTEQLSNAMDTADLSKYKNEKGIASLNVDPFIMGVGGDDSWSSCVHDKYLLPPAKYDFQLAFSARNLV